MARDLPDDAAAALVSRGRIIDLPGRDRPQIVEDGGFLRLLAEFGESDGQRLRLLWPAGPDWYRVEVSRHHIAGGVTAQASLVRAQPTSLPYGLSRRELDVLTRATMGQTNHAIACELFLSPRTVHSHIEHVLRKTGTSSRAEAAALAMRDGLLCPVPGALKHFIGSAR